MACACWSQPKPLPLPRFSRTFASLPPPPCLPLPRELPLLGRLDLTRRGAAPLLLTALREEDLIDLEAWSTTTPPRRPGANNLRPPLGIPATGASRSKGCPNLGPSQQVQVYHLEVKILHSCEVLVLMCWLDLKQFLQ